MVAILPLARVPTSSMRKFVEVLLAHPRVALAGVAGSGKTTLAGQCGDRLVVHTDDWAPGGARWSESLEWEQVPIEIARHCPAAGPLLVEGVRALGVIREGLVVDAIVWLDTAHVSQTTRQQIAAKGRRSNFERFLAEHAGRFLVYRL